MVFLLFWCSFCLKTNMRGSLSSVVISIVSIRVVIVFHLGLFDFSIFKHHTMINFFLTHLLVCSIGWHQWHDIVWLLHCKNQIFYSVKEARQSNYCTNLFVSKVNLDGLAINIFWPVIVLLDEGKGKHSSILQLEKTSYDTKTTAKYNSFASAQKLFGQEKRRSTVFPISSNSGHNARDWSFPPTILRSYKIPESASAIGWLLLPNFPGFLRQELKPGHIYLLIHIDMDLSM